MRRAVLAPVLALGFLVAGTSSLPALLSAPGAAVAAPLPLPARETVPAPQPALEADLLSATNAARARHGLRALRSDEGLARAAREHAAEMARLDYFSHGSPVQAHDTLQKRLALAGSPLVDVAENIVMLGEPGDAEQSARKAVDDWLGSPPHRANLLNPVYDVVGFGAARNAQGELFIVQDFGYQPIALTGVRLARASRAVTEVALTVAAPRATQALFRIAGSAPVTRSLPAGTSRVTLTTSLEGRQQLLAGVPVGNDTFVVDAGGTIDLGTGRYLRDPTDPRRHMTIETVRVRHVTQRGVRLELAYDAPAGTSLALFVNGAYRPQARTAPGRFALFLPGELGRLTVSVGVQGKGSTVEIIHSFHLDAASPSPTLLAGAAP